MPSRKIFESLRFRIFAALSLCLVLSASSMPFVVDSELELIENDTHVADSEYGNLSHEIDIEALPAPRTHRFSDSYRLFPRAYFERESPIIQKIYGPNPLSDNPEPSEKHTDNSDRLSVLSANHVLAFYGKPGATSMGILGEYPIEVLAELLEGYAKLYDGLSPGLGIVPAFYIIYGTCWPEGEIGYTRASVIEEYIAFAQERGWLVFLDHQIGKYGVDAAMEKLLPWLQYPNVHLALDPEWHTEKPMEEIGFVTATELNRAQEKMEEYLNLNNLPGIRMLVVHQFKPKMIANREEVRSDYDRVILVHTADGFGSPPLKRLTYKMNAEAQNLPVKGFKLFFESRVPGAGWDIPLMFPEEVMALDPLPFLIMYQ